MNLLIGQPQLDKLATFVDHLSLIVIDANNRYWKPCLLYVTLGVVTLHLDRYMLMMGVMVVMALMSLELM